MWWLIKAYFFILVLFTVSAKWIGETSPILTSTLYLPPAIWIIPGISFFLLQLAVDTKKSFFTGILVALFTFHFFGIPWSTWIPKESQKTDEWTLKVLTFNQGQSSNSSLEEFLSKHQPDIVVFQETTPARTSKYIQHSHLRTYAHISFMGEFSIMSKYPVLSSSFVLTPSGAIAAKYTIYWQDRPIRIYSVHLKSPRKALYATRNSKSFLATIFGNHDSPQYTYVKRFWHLQVESAKLLSQQLSEEELPCIAMGDTNAPPIGKIHSILTSDMTDAHEAVGKRTGFTFPGESPLKLSNYGPWMRIDKILSNSYFTPLEIEVESTQKSQHRAVFAKLRLNPLESQKLNAPR